MGTNTSVFFFGMLPKTHVLFDMDGLLLNTEDIYTLSTNEVLAPYGKEMSMDVKTQLMGLKPLEAAKHLLNAIGLLDLPPEEYLRQVDAVREQMWERADWMPGAKELLDHLFQNNIPFALATSSHRTTLAKKIVRHQERFSRFQSIVCGDDPEVLKGKPAPDCFLAAARRLGADPARCLVFEDAPNGVCAAQAAGMAVVWVPHGFMLAPGVPLDQQPVVRELAASETLASLADFKPERWGLPPLSHPAVAHPAASI